MRFGQGTQNEGYRIRDTEFRSRDLGYGIRDTEFGSRDLGYGIRDTKFGSRDLGYKILAAGLKPRARLGSSGRDFARSASNYRTGIREKDEGFLTRLRH